MRGDDGYREHVWNKRGSRFQLPRAPRPSRKTLITAIPSVGVVALSLVGLLAVPAGSPPPPPAVAAEPIATVEPTPTATEIATDPTPIEQPSPTPAPPDCHPKGIASHVLPAAPRSGSASLIAYPRNNGIWIYDVASNRDRALVKPGENCGYGQPRFIDRRTIAFLNRVEVDAVDVVTGAVHVLNTHLNSRDWLNDWIATYAVSPGGTALAAIGGSGKSTWELAVSSLRSSKKLFTKQIGYVCFCDGGDVPVDLGWSADGSLLLATVPTEQPNGLIYVFDRAGKEVVPPVKGHSPRWLGTSHSFIFNSYGRTAGNWSRFNLRTGKRTALLRSETLSAPVVSPNGTKVAFNDESKMRVVVYDLAAGVLRTIDGNHAYPLWLDNDRLAVSAVAPCNCEYPAFGPVGTVGAVSVTSGRTMHMRLTETVGADVFF